MPRSIFGEPQEPKKDRLSQGVLIAIATITIAAVFGLGVMLGSSGPTKRLEDLQARYSTLEKQNSNQREHIVALEKEVVELKNQMQSRKPVAKQRTKRQAADKRKKSRR